MMKAVSATSSSQPCYLPDCCAVLIPRSSGFEKSTLQKSVLTNGV